VSLLATAVVDKRLAVAMEASECAHVRIFWSKGKLSRELGSMYVLDFVIWRYLSVNARILLNSFVRNGSAFLSAGVLAPTAASLATCWACLQ
jgi:hypothetical protein